MKGGNLLNSVDLIGRVGGQVKFKELDGGKMRANFTIATGKDKTLQWHNIVAWDKQAELAHKYVTKGMLVHVRGRITSREWEDRQGNKVLTIEIIANNILFLSKTENKPQPDIDNVFPNADLSDFEDVPF